MSFLDKCQLYASKISICLIQHLAFRKLSNFELAATRAALDSYLSLLNTVGKLTGKIGEIMYECSIGSSSPLTGDE